MRAVFLSPEQVETLASVRARVVSALLEADNAYCRVRNREVVWKERTSEGKQAQQRWQRWSRIKNNPEPEPSTKPFQDGTDAYARIEAARSELEAELQRVREAGRAYVQARAQFTQEDPVKNAERLGELLCGLVPEGLALDDERVDRAMQGLGTEDTPHVCFVL